MLLLFQLQPAIDPAVFVLIGFGSLLFFALSLVLGGHGHGHAHFGHGHGIGHDHGTGHGHSHGSHSDQTSKPGNMSVLNIQVILLFLMGVSVLGYFADTYLLGAIVVILYALVGGLIFSGSGYSLMNYMFRNQGSWNTVNIEDAVGQTAKVLVGIKAGGRGKISCTVNGRIETFSAVSNSVDVPVYSQVNIVGVDGHTVIVEPLSLEQKDQNKLSAWRND